MNGSAHPVVKDVVLVGAGHAHVTVLRKFAMAPLPGVRLTLISREVHTPYSGMLPGLIAGHYDFDAVHIDTGPLARMAGARLYRDEATSLDLANRRVICANRPPVNFDLLSINIGSTPNTSSVPGAAEHTIPVKPIDGFLIRFEALLQRMIERRAHMKVALVGAGAGGVELLLSVERRLRMEAARKGLDSSGLSFVLITETADILSTFPRAVRKRFHQTFTRRGIEVICGVPVTGVEHGRLNLQGRPPVEADEILWTTQARPARWLKSTGLPLDDNGFLKVGDDLRVIGEPDIFAAGDTISFSSRDLPKSGVYAVRAGPVLATNIRNTLTGQSLKPFRPQRQALYLLTNGEKYATGTRNGLTFSGAWVWRWKDWIDRRFMAKFNDLPDMTPREQISTSPLADREALKDISAIAMRCGGCGAKVGATVLSRALGAITPVQRPDIVLGLNSPDDAAVVDTGGDKLSVQTVDYFRAIIDDPYLFGKIAANHALGDIYAMGGEPQSALAIATIPYGLERKVEADLSDMMTGANEILQDANCALVGGHTSEGAELSLGFAVNGLISRDLILRKGGLLAGDALIVTKPIGTGTLLAADMHGKAKARWISGAIEHMIKSNRDAAKTLQRHSVHAATDVTGFGLIGHLVEMVRASKVDVTISLARIPILPGAGETVARGIFSSLQPQNVRLRRSIRDIETASQHPLYPLLFDPQTAGGLLASVPMEQAERCITALQANGYPDASIIGIVRPASSTLEPITICYDRELPTDPDPREPAYGMPSLASSPHKDPSHA